MADNSESTVSSWDGLDAPHEGLVTGANGIRLHLIAAGPRREDGKPVVIFESGLNMGGSGWAAVQRLLGSGIRSYCYDRAGYGRSPAASEEHPRSAVNMAAELRSVLSIAGVAPPYVVVAHSYGGIIAREFLAAVGAKGIVGLVLVDANQEDTHSRLREPIESIQALSGADLSGMLLREESKYTPEEMDRIALDASAPTTATAASNERALMAESSKALARKQQLETQVLGMSPVTVIRGDSKRDLRRSLSTVELPSGGGGDARKQLETAQDFLTNGFDALDKELQMQQLRLSANCRFVQTKSSGHNVMGTEPELVAEEIRSVWESSQIWM